MMMTTSCGAFCAAVGNRLHVQQPDQLFGAPVKNFLRDGLQPTEILDVFPRGKPVVEAMVVGQDANPSLRIKGARRDIDVINPGSASIRP